MEWTWGPYTISTDKSLLDVDRICHLLKQTYWAPNRSREDVVRSLENALCYGVYEDGCQIGFGRIITDYVTTYYICDVVIDEPCRGRGLGKKLIGCMVESEGFAAETGLLITRDAHGLYRQHGFREVENIFMMRLPGGAEQPDPA